MENSILTRTFGTSRTKAAATAVPGSAPNGTLKAFTGTLPIALVVPGSVTFTITVGAATVTITDNGVGILTGSGVTGTLNYVTGAWTLTCTTAPDNSTAINAAHRYYFTTPTQVTSGTSGITGATGVTKYAGATAYGNIVPGTVTLTINFSSSGHNITDDGNGNLASANTTYGFIDYQTGQITIQFSGAPDNAAAMTATYKHSLENSTAIILTQKDFDLSGVKSVRVSSTATTQAGYLIFSSSNNGKSLDLQIQNTLSPGGINIERLSGKYQMLLMLAEKGSFSLEVI